MAEDGLNDGQSEQNDERDERIQPIPVIVNQRKTKYKPSVNCQNKTNLKTIKRSNKLMQELNLPTVMNLNPRSIYNKAAEFHNFV